MSFAAVDDAPVGRFHYSCQQHAAAGRYWTHLLAIVASLYTG
jgi:hypothetical protein